MSTTHSMQVAFAVAAENIGVFLDATALAKINSGESYLSGDFTWSKDSSGDYYVTTDVVIDSTEGVTVDIPTCNNADSIINNPENVNITLVGLDDNGLPVTLDAANVSCGFTVVDSDANLAKDLLMIDDTTELAGMHLVTVVDSVSNIFEGGDGKDLIIGTGEDFNHLSGKDGDDILYAGSGGAFLDGGTGADQLFGSDGTDILVFSADNAAMDGKGGIDFMVGVVDANSLETLFDAAPTIKNVEVFVMGTDSLSLISMDSFEEIGVTIDDTGCLKLSSEWDIGVANGTVEGYTEVVYNNDGEHMDGTTMLVMTQLLESAADSGFTLI
jgi:hypothetical protein